MNKDLPKVPHDGFITNNIFYLLAMFVASMFPFAARTVLSFMLTTPNAAELKADGSWLFDVLYPIVGLVTLAAFLFGGFYACYYTASKVAYKNQKNVDPFKMKMQMVLPSILIFLLNVYYGFIERFAGLFGIQFWYPAAVTASIFRLFDKTNLLASLSAADLVTTNFILDGYAHEFAWLTVLFAVFYSAAFAFACYYGRKMGMQGGLKKKKAFLEDLRNETWRR